MLAELSLETGGQSTVPVGSFRSWEPRAVAPRGIVSDPSWTEVGRIGIKPNLTSRFCVLEVLFRSPCRSCWANFWTIDCALVLVFSAIAVETVDVLPFSTVCSWNQDRTIFLSAICLALSTSVQKYHLLHSFPKLVTRNLIAPSSCCSSVSASIRGPCLRLHISFTTASATRSLSALISVTSCGMDISTSIRSFSLSAVRIRLSRARRAARLSPPVTLPVQLSDERPRKIMKRKLSESAQGKSQMI
jgi:hypothetical protein